MKAVLSRSGSVPVLHNSLVTGSPRVSFSVHDSLAGFFSGDKNSSSSPRISLHSEFSRRRNSTPASGIRRALSESDMFQLDSEVSDRFSRSPSFPARIPEEEYISEEEDGVGGIGSLLLNEGRDFDRRNYAGEWPESGIPVEELEFSGGGFGKGDGGLTGTFTGGNSDRSKIGAYYKEMLKSNPTNSLLLTNYAKFLHEVERDMVKAEEYYGRAILASPGDGEVLSLYGKLIWETQKDQERAKSYFDQAVRASPDDSMVLGSYACFMWEAEEEDEEDDDLVPAASMVEAF